MQKTINSIDGLRAGAALLVLIFHTKVLVGELDSPFLFILDTGWTGVDIFFTISGFVLFLSMGNKYYQEKKFSLKEYYINRFKRILPGYYFNVLGMIILKHASLWFSLKGLAIILMTLTFTQGFFSYWGTLSINGVLWTLCLEIQFYLVLPLIYKLFIGTRWPIGLVLMLGVSLIYRTIIIDFTTDMESYEYKKFLLQQLPGVIHEFAIGMSCGSIWINMNKKNAKLLNTGFPLTGLFGMMLFLSTMYLIDAIGGTQYWYGTGRWGYFPLILFSMLLSIGAAIIIFGVSLKGDWLSRILSNKILVYLGVVSYGIYLWHLPIATLLNSNLNEPDVVTKYIIITILCLILSVIWASISYFFVEKRFLVKKER